MSTEEEPAPRAEDAAARFEALRAHPRFEEAMRAEPAAAASPQRGVLILAVVGGVLVAVALSLGLAFLCAPLAILPLVALGVGGFFAAGQLRESFGGARQPLERRPALVLDERTHVTDGTGPARQHYLTLEFEDGRQSEHRTEGDQADATTPGQAGVAYLRGTRLVDFRGLDA